jgi:hypothetical protein
MTEVLDGLSGAGANRGVYFDGSGNLVTFSLTAAGLAVLDDADAETQRTTLGTRIHSPWNDPPGLYAPAWIPSFSSGAGVANRAYLLRVVPTRGMTIATVAFSVTTAATNDDACDVGYYTVSGSTLNRVASVGATSGKLNATTGVKTFTSLSWALAAGTVYYIGFSYGAVGGTAANLAMSGAGAAGIHDLMGAGVGTSEAVFKATSHPLPSSLSSLTTGLAACPILALRE